VRLAAPIRDRSRVRRAARLTRQGDDRYQRFVETTHEGVCVIDEQSRVVFANRRLCDMLGYRRAELSGREAMSLMDGPGAGQDFASAIAGKGHQHEVALRHKSGATVWASVRATPMLDEPGQMSGVLIMFSDITDRRRSEDLLRRSEARFRALVEHASDVMAILDPQGRTLYESPAMRQLVGARPGGYPANPPFAQVHPDDLPKLASDFAALAEGRVATLPLTGRFKHADGTWHNADGVGTNLLDDPAVGGIVLNFRDVTERMLAEQQAHDAADRMLQAQLEEQAKSLALLKDRERIAMDLHDGVIQSLYGVALRLGALRRRTQPGGAESGESADAVLASAIAELTETIQGIREYIYDLRSDLPQGTDLKTGLTTLAEKVAKSGLRPRLHLEADASHLRPEVVSHLLYIAHEALSNVVRHAEATNADIMLLPLSNSGLVLTIADNGKGFDPGRRGRRLGDGLHNIRQRTRLIGARLTVDSQLGSGTIVAVRIQ
jgi:PAS domain S-box-containing protein